MKPELSIFSIFSLIGSAQGLFLAFVLFGSRQNKLANRILAFFVFSFSLMMVENISIESKFFLMYPHFSATFGMLLFTLPPTFYLYIRAITTPSFKLRWKDGLHFIPLVFFSILNIPFYQLSEDEKIVEMVNEYQLSHSATVWPFYDPTFYQILVYFILSFRLIQRHSRYVKENFSDIEQRNLSWLRFFFFVCLGIWGLSIFSVSLWEVPYEDLLFSVAVYSMGYFSMSQPEVFAVQTRSTSNSSLYTLPIESVSSPKKYEKSTLTEEMSIDYQNRLLSLMSEKKLYLNPELTLQNLSEIMDVSTHHLSQVLNERLKQNFFDFVNSYRVQSVKEKLLSPKYNHLNILAVALESGFNSKTAFNASFKKHTGLTPSDFRKKHQKLVAA